MPKEENQYIRESYAHYLGRLTRSSIQFIGRSLEYIMSPEVKIITTCSDHDEMHRGIHDDYNRIK